MNEPGSISGKTPFAMCMMAEEQDEALADVIELANENSGLELNAAVGALAEIHELVRSYLDASVEN